ncbi:MAG: helix-turn-helix domain-containing protein, partial [Firmicutes bacterium]|nr:helix-turn-helix domain-containing protein [Bacillota bacterium]
ELILADIIADDSDDPKEEMTNAQMMKKLITEMRRRLSDREFTIVDRRYGLTNKIPQPQREVAKELGISRSYISRIEKHAIEIVREIINEHQFANFFTP